MSGGKIKPGDYLSSLTEKLQSLLDLLTKKRVLIVLDGFERELGAYASLKAAYQGDACEEDPRREHCRCASPTASEFLRRLMNPSVKSRVLITSQLLPKELTDPVSGVSVSGCWHWKLKGMGFEDADALLEADGIRAKPAGIESATQACGGSPLALRLLAGVVRGTRRTGRLHRRRRFVVDLEQRFEEHQQVLKAAHGAVSRKARSLLSRIAAVRIPATADVVAALNHFKTPKHLNHALNELIARGILVHEPDPDRFDMHPILRCHAYGRLRDATQVHNVLAEHLARVEPPVQVMCIDDLQPMLELYHHLVGAGRYDEACRLMIERLDPPLAERFAEHQTRIRLLRGLLPDGEDKPPRIENKDDRVWVLDALANAYSLSGLTRQAAAICEANLTLYDGKGDQEALSTLLSNLAGAQSRLGHLEVAEGCLRSLVDVERKLSRREEEAVARNKLGLLLAYRGLWEESLAELDAAFDTLQKVSAPHLQSMVFASCAQRALLMGDTKEAVEAAGRARAAVEQTARTSEPDEHDYVRSGWVLAAALVAQAAAKPGSGAPTEAETYLSDALTRCRRAQLLGFEPDILLTWARWHQLNNEPKRAVEVAGEALAVAERCEYRLRQADVHMFLARRALDDEDGDTARHRAEIASKWAFCDGPPFCYHPLLDEATALLTELEGEPRGLSEPMQKKAG